MATVRIATCNLENFDETGPGERPTLKERVALMPPQILRLRADIRRTRVTAATQPRT